MLVVCQWSAWCNIVCGERYIVQPNYLVVCFLNNNYVNTTVEIVQYIVVLCSIINVTRPWTKTIFLRTLCVRCVTSLSLKRHTLWCEQRKFFVALTPVHWQNALWKIEWNIGSFKERRIKGSHRSSSRQWRRVNLCCWVLPCRCCAMLLPLTCCTVCNVNNV